MKDKTCRMGVWESKRYCRSSKSISTIHSLLPNSVNSAFLQRSMCVVFGYYWCIIWVWEGWGGKEGRWVGSFLLKLGLIGEMKQWKEQTTNDLVLCPKYFIFSQNVIGNLNKDCERLFRSCECLKLISHGVPCLSLMLFPTKD